MQKTSRGRRIISRDGVDGVTDMISNEELQQKVSEILKKQSINLSRVATDSAALDTAAKLVTSMLPALIRPLVRERIRGAILQIAQHVPRNSEVPLSATPSESVEARVHALQDEVRRTFADAFATKRNLRGYDSDLDVLCARLVRDCASLEGAIPDSDKETLIQVLLAKAQVLGSWQKIQGSRGNQRDAAETYERALSLAAGLPERQADVQYQFGRFCARTDEAVGGGKDCAIEHFERALDIAPQGSVVRHSSEQELEKLQKRRWPF